MTADQYVALTTSIGACLSAVATFWTVRQIAKQREASYRPELLFSRTNFRALPINTEGRLGLPTQWVIDSGTEDLSMQSQEEISIPLRNVGLGAAKSVRICWSFPLEQAIANINGAAQRTLTPAYLTSEHGNITLKSETLGNAVSMWRNQQKASFDFVLPASIERDSTELSLPSAYILVCSALLFFAVKEKQRSRGLELPALTANVEYGDIGNRVHRSSFELNISIYLIVGEGEDFRGIIDCTKST